MVQQHVQDAGGRQAVLDDLRHLPGVRHVCGHTHHLVSLPRERRGRPSERVCLAIRDDEQDASPCQHLSNGTSEALRLPSDPGDPACEAEPLQAHAPSFALPSLIIPALCPPSVGILIHRGASLGCLTYARGSSDWYAGQSAFPRQSIYTTW